MKKILRDAEGVIGGHREEGSGGRSPEGVPKGVPKWGAEGGFRKGVGKGGGAEGGFRTGVGKGVLEGRSRKEGTEGCSRRGIPEDGPEGGF